MKKYRFWVPVFLVLMMVCSIYMLYDKKAENKHLFESCMESARAYRQQGITVDAERSYQEALALQPSLEVYIEIADFYKESNLSRAAYDWCEEILEKFPTAPESYEYMMDQYKKDGDYTACFALLDTMRKRKVDSPKVEEAIQSIAYSYYLTAEYDDVSLFGGGYASVLLNGYWGYVNTAGTQTVAAQFEKAGPFSGDLAPVVDKNGEAYFIDPSGNKKKVVSNVESIAELGLIENDIFALNDGKSWGFYQSDGTRIAGPFEEASNIGNGMAAGKRDGLWYILDQSGSELTGKGYGGVLTDEKNIVYRNDRLFVQEGSGYRMIDAEGNAYGDIYQDAHLFADATYSAVKIDGKWGYVDKTGAVMIDAQYQDARSFSNGFAAVKVDGAWGFIDTQGNVVISPRFEDVKDFSPSGTVYVNTGKEWELLVLYKFNH